MGVNIGFAAIAAFVANDLHILEQTGFDVTSDEAKLYKIQLKDPKNRLFSLFNRYQLSNIQENSVLSFKNAYAVNSPDFRSQPHLRDFFKVTATYTANIIDDYVAAAEAVNYPIYITQFSPQIGNHGWDNGNFQQNYLSKISSSLIANLFANATRSNLNTFENSDAEDESLIYQFDAEFMGIKHPRVYFFNQNDL